MDTVFLDEEATSMAISSKDASKLEAEFHVFFEGGGGPSRGATLNRASPSAC
jgi:hypothetical protein